MCYTELQIEGHFFIHPRTFFCRMAKLINSIKDKLTPNIVREVHRNAVTLTIVWVSGALLFLGMALALLCMYNRMLMLEQVIAVLAA